MHGSLQDGFQFLLHSPTSSPGPVFPGFKRKGPGNQVVRSLSSLMFIDVISSHSMECESIVANHIPYLLSFLFFLLTVLTVSLIFIVAKLFYQVI